MKRFLLILVALSVFTSAFVSAQSFYDNYYDNEEESYYNENDDYYDEDQKEHEENDEVTFVYNRTEAGDQMLKIGIGLTIPQGFGNPWPGKDGSMKLGGIGILGYHVFVTDYIAVGVDVGFGFNSTKADNMFNHMPVVATVTFEPSIKKVSFPISIGVGAAWETYNGNSYFPGLVFRASAGARYKINSAWAVGGDVSYTVLPQFNEIWKKGSNEVGRYITISATVNYYF